MTTRQERRRRLVDEKIQRGLSTPEDFAAKIRSFIDNPPEYFGFGTMRASNLPMRRRALRTWGPAVVDAACRTDLECRWCLARLDARVRRLPLEVSAATMTLLGSPCRDCSRALMAQQSKRVDATLKQLRPLVARSVARQADRNASGAEQLRRLRSKFQSQQADRLIGWLPTARRRANTLTASAGSGIRLTGRPGRDPKRWTRAQWNEFYRRHP